MMTPSHCILLVAAFVAVASAMVNDTEAIDSEDELYLDAVQHQQWVEDLGRRGCQYANKVRLQYGRHQLYFSGSLTSLGARHSRWMAHYNVFTHQNLNGLGAWVGPHWLKVTAENIAMSSPRSGDPSWDAHLQWYNSRGHFGNMISSRHTHCGVGIAYDGSGRWWGTQLFGYNQRVGNEGGSASAPASDPDSAAGRIPSHAPAPALATRASPSPRTGSSSGNSGQAGVGPLAKPDLEQSRLGEPLHLDGFNPSNTGITPPSL